VIQARREKSAGRYSMRQSDKHEADEVTMRSAPQQKRCVMLPTTSPPSFPRSHDRRAASCQRGRRQARWKRVICAGIRKMP